ncbi:MAG: MazG-like family protein [Candidatus Thermoplasmatota archaeon]|nr:MazG-like family protein [Candidatus Thermoplasmatota archaeon]
MDPEEEPSIGELQELIRKFISERDWDRFHRPKDVAAALSIEAGELQELYLWDRSPDREALEDEMADVFFFLLDMSFREDVDLIKALKKKLIKNEKKYPAHLVRGKDDKYTKYQ